MSRLPAALTAILFIACGGGDSAEQNEAPANGGDNTPAATTAPPASAAPDWFRVDDAARTVEIDIVAGSTTDNNSWNFNGLYGGSGKITVPVGYEVVINFSNEDAVMAHSIGVDARTSGFPAAFTDPVPVFEGGISPNPTSLMDATGAGESAVVTFTASEAGEYTLVCYVPGHAVTGMYIPFAVSASGDSGVEM